MSRSRRTSARYRPAFTLVELLAASTLAAALMIAAMHVLRSLGRPPSLAAARSTAFVEHADLRELIRRDLVNALGVRFDRGSLFLVGYGAFDPVSREAIHRPVAVTYLVREIGGRKCLVRQQSDLRDGSAELTFAEPVAWDVASLDVAGIVPRVRPVQDRDAKLAKTLGVDLRRQPRERHLPSYFAIVGGLDPLPHHLLVALRRTASETIDWDLQLR